MVFFLSRSLTLLPQISFECFGDDTNLLPPLEIALMQPVAWSVHRLHYPLSGYICATVYEQSICEFLLVAVLIFHQALVMFLKKWA